MLAPLCSRNANTTVQCPIAAGPYEVQQTVALPKEVPRGMLIANSIDSLILKDF